MIFLLGLLRATSVAGFSPLARLRGEGFGGCLGSSFCACSGFVCPVAGWVSCGFSACCSAGCEAGVASGVGEGVGTVAGGGCCGTITTCFLCWHPEKSRTDQSAKIVTLRRSGLTVGRHHLPEPPRPAARRWRQFQ